MMQNGLTRLLEGIAQSLVEVAAPAIEDPYARGQVLAASELLVNLAARVTWDPAYLGATPAAVRELVLGLPLAARSEAGRRALHLDAADEPQAAEGFAAAHLTALAELAARAPALDAVARERLAAIVDADLDLELSRLRARPEARG